MSEAAIIVSVETARWRTHLPDPAAWAIREAGRALAAACPGIGPAGISILLTDDATLQALNRTWRHKDSPTNVLSFPATETREGTLPQPPFSGVPLALGDIALALETCEREARAQGKSTADHATHLLVHGVLHLLGYDHEVDDAALRMEALERRILASAGIADPYEQALAPTADD